MIIKPQLKMGYEKNILYITFSSTFTKKIDIQRLMR